jgi:K+-transporting ATPase A subunit
MTLISWAQIALVLAFVLAAAVPLGRFIARVAAGERTFLHPALGPVERAIYAVAGIDPPPLKWSALRYGFEPEEDREDGQEAPA